MFRGVDLPAGEYQLQIVDVDLIANDDAGRGECALGRTCTIGQARVEVMTTEAFARAEEARRRAEVEAARRRIEEATAEQARFSAMSAAEHLAAAQSAMARGCPTDGEPTTNLDETARHIGAMPRRAARSRQARAVTDELARCMAVREGPHFRTLTAGAIAHRLAAGGMAVSGAVARGPRNTTFVVISPECSQATAYGITRAHGRSLRGSGFALLICERPTGFLSRDSFEEPL